MPGENACSEEAKKIYCPHCLMLPCLREAHGIHDVTNGVCRFALSEHAGADMISRKIQGQDLGEPCKDCMRGLRRAE